MSDIYAFLNFLFYFIVLFIVFVSAKRNNNYIGLLIVSIYTFSAFCAWILLVYSGSLRNYNNITFWPFVYLFVVLLILLWPIIKFNDGIIREILTPYPSFLNIFTCIVLLLNAISFVNLLPDYLVQLKMAFLNDDFRNVYNENFSNASAKTGLSTTNLFTVVASSFSDIVIFLFFYYLSIEKQKILKILLFISMVLALIPFAASAARNGIVTFLITLLFAMILFRNIIQRSIMKKVVLVLSLTMIVAVFSIYMISASRFSESTYYSSTLESLFDYGGQSMLNFNNYVFRADAIQEGDNSFPIGRALLGMDFSASPQVRQFKWEPKLGIPLYLFYTIIGDLVLDYGSLFTIFAILIISLIISRKTKIRQSQISFHQLFLIYVFFLICSQGIFYFMYKTIAGNLKLISMFCFYLLFCFLSFIKYYNESKSNCILSSSVSSDSRK